MAPIDVNESKLFIFPLFTGKQKETISYSLV